MTHTLAEHPAVAHGARPLIEARGVTKSYGRTRALAGVDLTLARGEILGLVGHNGAGKSTLVRAIAGLEAIDGGSLLVAGADRSRGYTLAAAEAAGVRLAYQELSLAPDLTVAENAYLSYRGALPRLTWQRTAGRRIARALDEIFPGHGISVHARVGELPMPKRQMVEIARATLADEVSLLILDEPTESLGPDAAASMYAHVHRMTAAGASVLLISHRMGEVLGHCDRVAVLQDGRVTAVRPAREVDEPTVLRLMGGEVHAAAERRAPSPAATAAAGEPVVRFPVGRRGGATLEVRPGEIVGLAGLAGQGQQELLERLWRPGLRALSRAGASVPRSKAFVPGDRQTSGILPLWTVAQNIAVGTMRRLARAGVIPRAGEQDAVATWVERLAVKGGATAPILSLSGGNQQKVLVARAFASDARLILLDDPFRGVDVQTKNEIYALMRAEAERGRSIVWYSTENSEMAHCDRAYVFRAGEIVAELRRPDITEERIVAESFAAIEDGEEVHV
ncbi:sugar ABC transporter ATP-binding protein [Georgenia ruanii]|uniref:ATP-binding cassette domain-containing protein n=1 Tax=Georgenia ruanii TaxID=348442 RepID=A0A7J9V0J9_9MICO|nr:sugar ABC transporter ATP-binding protein [Georgenia ruanii]MPV89650.1 ATP-binding cassette domain-containing protein [Georgenia ruanii]